MASNPARCDASLDWPAPFVVGLAGPRLAVLLASPWLPKRLPSAPQALASRVGYPGLVVATGLGWLLLLDLSANGNFSNRYLALYHHGHLWLGMLALTLVAFLRQPVGRALAWALSIVDRVRRACAAWHRLRRDDDGCGRGHDGHRPAVGALLSNMPQLTSEVGRAWLIIGASWFFFLRGDPLAKRLARRGALGGFAARYVSPLLCVVAVLIGVQVITHDMGPLLIACYGAGAFVAASIAMWWQQRSGAQRTAFALAIVCFVAWILATTVALFELGASTK